jgi:hypothetical protein
MDAKFDALNEIDQDTLAKISLAVAAGLASVAGGKILYKKYKEKQLQKKYIGDTQEDDRKHRSIDPYTNAVLDVVDANILRYLNDARK